MSSRSSCASCASCVTRFLCDPWSAAKVVIPSVAIEVVLHNKVWEKTSLRHLTLYLAVVNVYWFATSLNVGFFETPVLASVPSLDESQKIDASRHRLSWLNKAELALGVLSLDLYCEWRKRIIDHNGYVDFCLSKAVLGPMVITVAQAVYFWPKLNERAQKRIAAKGVSVGPEQNEVCCVPKVLRAYVGLEAVKVVGLAVAGLRFGKMLTV